MLALFRTLSLRYLGLHWARSGLVALSIGLGVATWVATDALQRALDRSLREAASPLRGTADLSVTNDAAACVDASLADRVRKVDGVERVDPIVIESVTVSRKGGGAGAGPDKDGTSAQLLGLPPPGEGGGRESLADRGVEVLDLDREKFAGLEFTNRVVRLSWPLKLTQLPLLGKLERFPALARWNWPLKVAGRVNLPARLGTLLRAALARTEERIPVLVGEELDAGYLEGERTFLVRVGERQYTAVRVGRVRARGAAAMLGGHVLVTVWTEASRMIGHTGEVHRLDVTLGPGADREAVAGEIGKELADRAKVQSPQDQDERLKELTRGLQVGFRLCGFGALVVGLFLVYNVMAVSVAERRHDIGILRSVGSTRTQVRLLFVGEALVMGLAGSALGIPLGLGMAYVSLGPVQKALHGIFLPLHGRQVETSLGLVLLAVAGGLATTLLAALVPASRAAAEEPAEAVRRAPPVVGTFARLLQVGGSLTLVTLGYLLMAGKASLAPEVVSRAGAGLLAFVALALILLGGLLATPLLASYATRLLRLPARRLLSVPGRLAADNLVRSPVRTGLVIAALAACVALMVMNAGVIRSNEAGFSAWIDDSFKADLYISSGGPISASGQTRPLSEASAGELATKLPAGTRLVGESRRYVDWGPENRPGAAPPGGERSTKVYLILLDARAYCEANAARPDPDPALGVWRRLGPGTAVVSENFALLHGVGPGDVIRLRGRQGMVPFEVAGTVRDYNWIRGTIFLDRQASKEAFGASEVHAWEAYLPAGADADAARDRLQKSDVAARRALATLTRGEVREGIRTMILRVYSVVYSQLAIIGLVAVIGVVAALLISVLGRRRELGLLRAVGGTRPQLLQTVLAEAVLIGLVGTVLGVLVGLPIEWYTVRVTVFEETGFVFPVKVPWAEAAVIAALAVLSATLAGLAPAVHAMRLGIADAIAYE